MNLIKKQSSSSWKWSKSTSVTENTWKRGNWFYLLQIPTHDLKTKAPSYSAYLFKIFEKLEREKKKFFIAILNSRSCPMNERKKCYKENWHINFSFHISFTITNSKSDGLVGIYNSPTVILSLVQNYTNVLSTGKISEILTFRLEISDEM